MGEVVPEDDPDPVQLDTPYLTILAIVVPICGVVLGFIGDRIAAYLYSNDQGQWVALGYVALPVILGFFAGLFLTGVAIWRNERWRIAQFLALLINGGPTLILLIGGCISS
jgi:hypothetical protein